MEGDKQYENQIRNESLIKKLAQLAEEELSQVTGGVAPLSGKVCPLCGGTIISKDA